LTLKAALLFVFAGVAMVFYFREERARVERQKIAEQTKGMGRPKVGGPFNLVDHNGHEYTDVDLKGKYALVGWHQMTMKRRKANAIAGVLWLYALPRHMPR
jgi:protein SCO1/2